jgi:hypothetical protein
LRIDDIEAVLKPAIEQARGLIAERRKSHPDLLHDDPYMEKLVSIIGKSVGVEPEKHAFDEACKRTQERIERKQPPGFLDNKKPAPDRFGDVLIWFELLDFAKSVKKPIILVTDDEKEDWWQIFDGQKLGPQPELREEMRKFAGVEFSLTDPAYFMESVGNQLKVEAAKGSVDDAVKVAAEVRERFIYRVKNLADDTVEPLQATKARLFLNDPRHSPIRKAEPAIRRWILRLVPGATVSRRSEDAYDFVFQTGVGPLVGVDIVTARNQFYGQTIMRIRDRFLRAHYEISSGHIEDFLLVVLSESEEEAQQFANRIVGREIEPRYSMSIGYLNSEGEYEEFQPIGGSVMSRRSARKSTLPREETIDSKDVET